MSNVRLRVERDGQESLRLHADSLAFDRTRATFEGAGVKATLTPTRTVLESKSASGNWSASQAEGRDGVRVTLASGLTAVTTAASFDGTAGDAGVAQGSAPVQVETEGVRATGQAFTLDLGSGLLSLLGGVESQTKGSP